MRRVFYWYESHTLVAGADSGERSGQTFIPSSAVLCVSIR